MTTSTIDRILEAAAEARAAGITQRSHRPSQRRAAEEAGSIAATTVRGGTLEIREADQGDGLLRFTGFASVYDRGYEMWDMFGPYTEQVIAGAGAETLARADLDVPFVIQHKPETVMARTTNGSLLLDERTAEDDVAGLHVEAPSLDPTDRHVAEMAPKLRNGLYDEMSFRFRIDAGEWAPDWTEFHIKKYDLHRGDVSVVMYGANPHTQGAGLRTLPDLDDLTDSQLRELENALHARRRENGGPMLSRTQLAALTDLY